MYVYQVQMDYTYASRSYTPAWIEMYSSASFTAHRVSGPSACVSMKPIDSVEFLATNAVISYPWCQLRAESLREVLSKYDASYKLHHGANRLPRLLLVPRNSLATQQAPLLSSIPVEFDGSILGCISALSEDTERLEDAHRPGAVIVGTWGGEQREEIVH